MKRLVKSSTIVIFFLLFNLKAFGFLVVRDAETESYLREMLDEILIISDIKPSSVNLFLIQDDTPNAFVAGGPNVFINTGLIQVSKSYEVLQAVLAHEVGHLKASHSINFDKKIEQALLEALLYSASGVLIALAGGASSAILAGTSILNNVAEKRILSYSRVQEAEADFYTFQVLKKLKASGDGAMQIFKIFYEMQEKQADTSKINQYSTTHPLPSSRLKFFENKFKSINYTPILNHNLAKKHLFVTAKLAGYFGVSESGYSLEFLKNPTTKLYFEGFSALRLVHPTTNSYPEKLPTLGIQNLKKAEEIFQNMLKQDSKNPYLYEILGELAYKNRDYNSAIFYFSKALEISPNSFLFALQISDSYLAKKDFENAILFIEKASKQEPYNPQPPFKLAEVYSQNGQNSIAKVYFLESEVLKKNYQKAKLLLKTLKQENPLLPKNIRIKLNDIEEFLKNK